jgi:hypothetical protein
MSQYQAHTGFWINHSRSPSLGATLTLHTRSANILISALTVFVTICTTCFWIIAAYLLHQIIIRRKTTDVVGLQHQVILRNSSSPLGSLWDIIKVQAAWRNGSIPKIKRRTLGLAIPALLIWLLFSIASLFVSEIASKGSGGTEVLLVPNNCGVYHYNNSAPDHVGSLGAQLAKTNRDTIRARAYAGSFYDVSSSSVTQQSVFAVDAIPYKNITNTSCPFESSRCLEPKGAFSIGTPLLDSHSIFGINAPKNDRVQIQKNATCSVLQVADLVESFEGNHHLFNDYYFGPLTVSSDGFVISNYTFEYDKNLTLSSIVSYVVW